LRFPLAEYAVPHWVGHALFENVSLRIKYGVEDHFLRWIRIRDMDDNYPRPAGETLPEQLEAAAMYYAALCGFSDVI